MFCYRIREYIGAYMAVLGHTDTIVFGGGIGEHSETVRERVCGGLEPLGIVINSESNRAANGREAFSKAQSPITVYVIALNEELYTARAAARLLSGSGQGS
jgi:acetate kinase